MAAAAKSFVCLALGFASQASAFVTPSSFAAGTQLVGANAGSSVSKTTMMAEKSAALPFLERPATLGDGSMAGDVGFDPAAISNTVPISWLREAELKHGRICMLAIVGWIATDLGIHLPGDMHAVSAMEAHDAALKSGAMLQLNLWISIAEIISSVAVFQMLNGSGRAPGDFGFDPLNFSKTPEAAKKLALQEITHCRLAMLAFSGIATQAALGHSFPYF